MYSRKSLWFGQDRMGGCVSRSRAKGGAQRGILKPRRTSQKDAGDMDHAGLSRSTERTFPGDKLSIRKRAHRSKGMNTATKIKDKEAVGFRIKLDRGKDPQAIEMIKKEGSRGRRPLGILREFTVFENDASKIWSRPQVADPTPPNQFATWPAPMTGYFRRTLEEEIRSRESGVRSQDHIPDS